MQDRELHKRIAKLVAEERELEEGHIGSWATAEQEQRLREVREALDQSWDLLRKAGASGVQPGRCDDGPATAGCSGGLPTVGLRFNSYLLSRVATLRRPTEHPEPSNGTC